MIKACYYSFRLRKKVYKKYKSRKSFNRAKRALWNKRKIILGDMTRY